MPSPPEIDPTPQLVVIARLSEYCQYRGAILRYEADPWDYMLRKLKETEEPLIALKENLLAVTRERLFMELKAGGLGEERCADYKMIFERLLCAGDFVDVAFNLYPGVSSQAETLTRVLSQVKPVHSFVEERKPENQRSPAWQKLVAELYRRLGLDRLGQILERKPPTLLRKAMVLRRVRRNVAEYCTVVHIPTDPKDTFTPFILPRLEALIAANLRFLKKYR
ncbi:MAG TPA: hypothetical protein DEB40_12490 [Elusimicrobia bacterium]|nr:hypothetical protein [Elusimicrobiota bacterium]HBT62553.1 hypothetical protein [Elusimicrobiota bacterium]